MADETFRREAAETFPAVGVQQGPAIRGRADTERRLPAAVDEPYENEEPAPQPSEALRRAAARASRPLGALTVRELLEGADREILDLGELLTEHGQMDDRVKRRLGVIGARVMIARDKLGR